MEASINIEQLIIKLQEDKITKPDGVIYEDLKCAVSEELRLILNKMYAEKKIQVHRTLNSKLIVYVGTKEEVNNRQQ